MTIEVHDHGSGPAVFILPSLGRGAQDYDELTELLNQRGVRVLRPETRGIGNSTGPLASLTMQDLAADVALAIEGTKLAPAFVAGHAFGNFVARMLATGWPDLVRAVAIVAGSPGILPNGELPYDPVIQRELAKCSDLSLDDDVRIEALNRAFFAPGNDSSVWLGGWHPEIKEAQRAADAATPVSVYFAAGKAPILEVQAACDTIADARYAHLLREQLGARVKTLVIENAGHALIPEQPLAVADVIAAWVLGSAR
ncbi:alpha/beta fold hydrolase [Bosea thiooxidans]